MSRGTTRRRHVGGLAVSVGTVVGLVGAGLLLRRAWTESGDDALSTYLHDHLAGATSAVKMVTRLQRQWHGTDVGAELGAVLREIRADHDVLMTISEVSGGSARPARATLAWFGETAFRLRTSWLMMSREALQLFESLEVLSLGIEGKRSLWRALRAADLPALARWDFDHLEQRAQEQRDRVETMRLLVAPTALR